MKHIVKRGRPCGLKRSVGSLIAKPPSYFFPSGHTVSSFAVEGVLSVNFNKYKLIFIVLAILIAFSRLYLNVHYPTDIIAGIAIGLLCSKLIYIAFQQGYFVNLWVVLENIK